MHREHINKEMENECMLIFVLTQHTNDKNWHWPDDWFYWWVVYYVVYV